MVFYATFNNISMISWREVFWWREQEQEYPNKTTDLPQITNTLDQIKVLSNAPRHERNSNSQL
jgi:hypothetical protein